ncbi:hypothetical protein F9279_12040 [Bacillus sp. B1-b2]|nr:hypothetical protein F9279_12040 [Bacillus sp. B1-b2]
MYIGISFNMERYRDIEESLGVYSDILDKKLKMYLLADLNLLELHLQFIDKSSIDRVLLYDYKELGTWENFKQFSNVCKKYGVEWGIVKEDI